MQSTDGIRMYWWNDHPNFGDALNPLLVEKLFDKKVTWSPLQEAQLTGAGSLLQWIEPIEYLLSSDLHIWGSGYMFDKEPRIESHMVISHAVRGAHSVAFGGLPDSMVLGDPGICANLLLDGLPPKKYAYGIIPHLWHVDDPILTDPNVLKVIDVRQDPLEVISQIAECDFIFSSSLHGLIVADSLGIPNQWVKFGRPLFGGDWKFNDYYSIYKTEPRAAVRLDYETNLSVLASTLASTFEKVDMDGYRDNLIKAFPKFL